METSIKKHKEKKQGKPTAETSAETEAVVTSEPVPAAEQLTETATSKAAEATSQPAEPPVEKSEKEKKNKDKKDKEKKAKKSTDEEAPAAASASVPESAQPAAKISKQKKQSATTETDNIEKKASNSSKAVSATKQAKQAKQAEWDAKVAAKIKETQIQHGFIEAPEGYVKKEPSDTQDEVVTKVKIEPGVSQQSTASQATVKPASHKASTVSTTLKQEATANMDSSFAKKKSLASSKTDGKQPTPVAAASGVLVSAQPASGSTDGSAPAAASGSPAGNPDSSEQDLTDMFGPDCNVDVNSKDTTNGKALFKACDLVVPGIALKKMKQALDDSPGSNFVAVLGGDTVKAYRGEKPGVHKMVLADFNKYSTSFWKRTSAHLTDEKITLVMTCHGNPAGFVQEVPWL